MQPSPSRRFYLRVAAKLMALTAIAFFTVTLISGLLPQRGQTEPPLTIGLSRLTAGLARFDWGSRRVLVLRREPEAVSRLQEVDGALADPDSIQSEQPSQFKAGRSESKGIFIAYDYDPDFGCPLDFVAASEKVPVSPWFGGFRAPCSGSFFDLAGRVYANQRTVHNLRVPPYRIDSGNIILGG